MARLTDDPADPALGHGVDAEPIEQHDVLAELQRAVGGLAPHLFYGMEKIAANELRRRRNICALTNYLAAHPCVDCGESDPIVLDFDHQAGKVGGIAANLSMLAAGASLERLAREIAKCEVRCSNCHRRRTAVQLDWHSYLIKRPFERVDGAHN